MIASIDIGTTYSSICILGPDGKAQPVDISTGASMFGSKYSLPSAVFIEDGGGILVGQAAMNSRKHKPQNFRNEFKRHLGEDFPLLVGERSFRPEALYTELFRHMKARAEKLTGESIEKAYLTYPASYGKKRREKLRAAANAAGLFDLELVDEPTAAAMRYCAEGYVKDGQTLLVYDFGGGTFDVSLIRYENGKFELLSEPLGLERCGGMDIDYLISLDMRDTIEKEMPGTWDMLQQTPNRFLRFTSQLNELAVKAKHHLSDANTFEEYIEIGMDDVHYQLTQERLNGMIAELVGNTVKICRRALDEAGVAASEVSAVLMVGGTTRIPLVQEMARKITGKPVLCAADLELIVSQGALLYNKYRESEQQNSNYSPKKRQPATNVKKHSAEDYFNRGQMAAKNQAWSEAAEQYRQAAFLGHKGALRELSLIQRKNASQNLPQQKHIIPAVVSIPEKKQPVTNIKKRTFSAEDYFNQGQMAAKNQAWSEAAEHYRQAAILGHKGALRELSLIQRKNASQNLPQQKHIIPAVVSIPEKKQPVTNIKKRTFSAEDYFNQGQMAAKNQAWSEAAEHYRQAAILGHKGALRELSLIQRAGKQTQVHQPVRNQGSTLEQLAQQFIASGNYTEIKRYLHPDTVKAFTVLIKKCKVPADETIIFAHDDTVFRSGSNGFIVTNRGIHTNNWLIFGHEIIFTSWQEFTDSSIIFSKEDAPQVTRLKLPSGGIRSISSLIVFNSDVSTAEQTEMRKEMKNFWHALHHFLRTNRREKGSTL